MITGTIKTQVDNIWNAFWSGGIANPMEVIETAEAYNRLYEIEKATMYNVMERFSKDHEQFNGCKVFVNSIPGYFLNDSDSEEFAKRYSEYVKDVVFEITEHDTVSDDELQTLKARGYAVVATELGGADFYANCPHEKAVLVIGSEGRGVSKAVSETATHHLALPMRGGAESLNAAVAAGIMIYEMAR